MFAMLKNAVAAAVKSIQTQQVEKHITSMKAEQTFDEALKASNTKAIQRSVTPPKRFVQTKGDFQFYHLDELKSSRVVNAICSLGCWIALAKGFGAYTTVKTAKNAEMIHTRVIDSFEQFHGWNHGHRVEEQLIMGSPSMVDTTMGQEAVQDILIKLSYVTPMAAKGPALEALKVLARVRGCEVDDLVKQRNKRAEEQTVAKMEAIDKFIIELFGFSTYGVDDEQEPTVKLELDKVLTKIEQTLAWVAGWNTTTEAGQLAQVSELILIEGDLNYLRSLRPAGDDGQRFHDGIATCDSVMYRDDWDHREGTTSSRGDGRSRNKD